MTNIWIGDGRLTRDPELRYAQSGTAVTTMRLAVDRLGDDTGADASLAALVDRNGPLPATLQACTGGGGTHLYFMHPGGRVPNSAGRLGPGLDVRGDGGYVLVSPSRRRPLPLGRSSDPAATAVAGRPTAGSSNGPDGRRAHAGTARDPVGRGGAGAGSDGSSSCPRRVPQPCPQPSSVRTRPAGRWRPPRRRHRHPGPRRRCAVCWARCRRDAGHDRQRPAGRRRVPAPTHRRVDVDCARGVFAGERGTGAAGQWLAIMSTTNTTRTTPTATAATLAWRARRARAAISAA